MITRPMIGLSLSSPLQALQVLGLPVLSLGSVRPVILPVSIPPCSESSTSEITLPLFSSIVFHGPTGTAAATARPTPNTTPSPINPQVRRIALSFRLPTGQFWKISVDCTVMAFPHQFSVWAEARSARDRKSTRLNSSHTVIYTLSLHDALPISLLSFTDRSVLEDLSRLHGDGFPPPVLGLGRGQVGPRSEEHTSELQSHSDLHSFPTRRSSDLSPFVYRQVSSGRSQSTAR